MGIAVFSANNHVLMFIFLLKEPSFLPMFIKPKLIKMPKKSIKVVFLYFYCYN